MPLVRYIADITPTEKAMLTDRNWPLVSLLVFTCAAAEQPNSFRAGNGQTHCRDTGMCCVVYIRGTTNIQTAKAHTKQILEIEMSHVIFMV